MKKLYKTKKINHWALCLSMGLLSCGTSSAVVLAQFDFDSESAAVTNELYSSSTSDISFGGSWTITGGELVRNAAIGSKIDGQGLTNPDNQFSFTYTVTGLATGETLSLESGGFIYAERDLAGNTGRYRWYKDTTTPISGSIDPAVSGTFTDTFNSNLTDIQGLVNGDSVTITLGHRDNVTSGTIAFDSVVLNGTITGSVVPEPSSTLMLGLSGALVLLRRRRA